MRYLNANINFVDGGYCSKKCERFVKIASPCTPKQCVAREPGVQVLHLVLKDLKTASLGLLLRLSLVAFAFWMVWLDIAVYQTQMLEMSFTEISQEAMLFICALLFWLSPSAEGQKGFNILAGGFFACLLTRELDGLMDPISHSAWCWPFLLIATSAICIAFNRKNRAYTLEGLAIFTKTPAFGALSTALGVLVFSRVFGMGSLWHLILDEGYARVAKTTVEEGVELLAYSMWLAATLEYYFQQRAFAFRTPAAEAMHKKQRSISSSF